MSANEKMNYLVKTLSRTTRKDYENFVINRIYNLLNDFEIKPVSQQYVKRDKGYARIDLYFPQLNIGIEVDEAHHLNKSEEDKLRSYEIANVLSDYIQIRIPIFTLEDGEQKCLSFEEIDREIREAVKKIEEKRDKLKDENNFKPWDGRRDIFKAQKEGCIKIEDNYIFNQREVREFFGKKGNCRKSWYRIKKDKYIWLPGLALKYENTFIPYKKNEYLNILSDDGRVIYEHCSKEKIFNYTRNDIIVFMKMKDKILNHQVYKFIGIFRCRENIEMKNLTGKNEDYIVYDLIEDKVDK
jgi:restriction endonuclease pvuRts1 I